MRVREAATVHPEMADVFTVEKRSAVMSRIRSRGNRDTELRMIQLMREHRVHGWRRGWPLFGKPDFVFPRERLALFVDGCFWHGCPKAKHAPAPKDRSEWWASKLTRNRERDRLVTRTLRRHNWTVLRVWECDLRHATAASTMRRVKRVMGKLRTKTINHRTNGRCSTP
jgi:DNA mismatch endonuclease (patch repair protein)